MKKGTIYRVEHKITGCGPYVTNGRHSNDAYNTVHRNLSYNKNPSPFTEFAIFLHHGDNLFCGFSTIKKLGRWFNKKTLLHILKYEFRIVIYKDVDIEYSGSKQDIFHKPKDIRRGTDITDKALSILYG